VDYLVRAIALFTFCFCIAVLPDLLHSIRVHLKNRLTRKYDVSNRARFEFEQEARQG
jgi:hypothetical protein